MMYNSTRDRAVTATAAQAIANGISTEGGLFVPAELPKLTAEDIQDADVIIFSHDIAIRGQERFAGKKVVDVPISTAMKQPKSLISTIEKKLAAK